MHHLVPLASSIWTYVAMAKRLPAAAVFVQAGPRTAGLAGQQRGRSAALGPTAARAGPEPAQPVAAGHCTLGTGRRRSSCLARSQAGARDGAAQGHSPGAAAWEQGQDTGGCRGGRRRRRRPRHGVPRRRRRREVRETTNGHVFTKRMTRRCRGRRDLPCGGDGFRRRRPRWPEKLAEGSPKT